MNNEIKIKAEDILLLPDNSITDPEIIRQIALYGIKYSDDSLYIKIKKTFEYCGLYPHLIESHNVFPYKMNLDIDNVSCEDVCLEINKLK